MADDETISSFLAITGISDVTQATSYLEMSGGDLETAVGLYLEHNAAGNQGTANSARGADAMAPIDVDGIRAPDAVQRDRLVEDVPMQRNFPPMMMPMMGGGGGTGNVFVDARAMANAMNVHHRDVWGDHQGDDNDNDEDEVRTEVMHNGGEDGKAMDEEDGEDEDFFYGDRPSHRNGVGSTATLSDIFSAPRHLMHAVGGFQGARSAAKDQKKWLLVNIQADTDFACHALNRDVWRDELVINIVQEVSSILFRYALVRTKMLSYFSTPFF